MQSEHIFVSEDCSSIIPKLKYDANVDYFNGFVTPIFNGVPSETTFQCVTFEHLKQLFETTDLASMVNIHCIQPLTNSNSSTSASPMVLSAYGTDNQLTAIDILKRWLMIFKQFAIRGVRVIGYSTDGDPKFLKSMRLAANFFVKPTNINLNHDPYAFKVDVPSHWRLWFFLDSNQLFLFMQDGPHVYTKMRNRLLSKTACLTMGNYRVSIEHLFDLINNNNKLDHNLSKSDLDVKDKQNFHSCQKICDEKVLNILMTNDEYKATYIYLVILNLLIDAYTNVEISLSYRIYCAWITVFFVRFWRIWLHLTRSSRRGPDRDYFITSNAQIAIEMNAHFLIYMYLLQNQPTVPSTLSSSAHLFSSQACENIFRNARALSGVYSTRINFSIKQFLKRVNKLNILTETKQSEMNNDNQKILFPIHRKFKRLNERNDTNFPQSNVDLDVKSLEKVILQAFNIAQEMTVPVGMAEILTRNDLFDIKSSSVLTKKLLQLFAVDETGSFDDDQSSDEDMTEEEDDWKYTLYDADESDDADTHSTITFENLKSTTYSGFFRMSLYRKSYYYQKFSQIKHHFVGEEYFLSSCFE